jgi:hypothetical protein
VDAAAVQACASGDLAEQLQRSAFLATSALRPPHTFVPWVVIDGDAACLTDGACGHIPQQVCAAYTGRKPRACGTYGAVAEPSREVALGLRGQSQAPASSSQVCMNDGESTRRSHDV